MAENKAKWMQAIAGCVTAFVREQASSSCPVVDYELRANIAGSPDDLCVWFICRTKDEKADFVRTERPRSISSFKKKMISAGFPDSAVASVEIRITSRDEVEQAGGSAFFR